MGARSVLVIEDDIDIMESVALALDLDGFDVMRAVNGAAGLDLLDRLTPGELPQCILLDLMMPVLDGRGFLREFVQREAPGYRIIKVVIASANTSMLFKEHHECVVDRINKPMDLDLLLNVIGKHCLPQNL